MSGSHLHTACLRTYSGGGHGSRIDFGFARCGDTAGSNVVAVLPRPTPPPTARGRALSPLCTHYELGRTGSDERTRDGTIARRLSHGSKHRRLGILPAPLIHRIARSPRPSAASSLSCELEASPIILCQMSRARRNDAHRVMRSASLSTP